MVVRVRILWLAFALAARLLAGGQTSPSRTTVDALLTAHDYSGALTEVDALLAQQQTAPRWLARGIALRGLKRTGESLTAFEHALYMEPRNQAALRGAAEAAFALHKDKARPLVQQLLQAEPANPVAHAMAGSLAYERGDCAEALTHFASAEPVVSSNRIGVLQFSDCLIAAGKPARAVSLLERLEAREDDALVSYDLAYALFAAERFDESVTRLEKLRDRQPDNAAVWNLLAADYSKLERTEGALNAYRAACEKAPDEPGFYVDLARFAMEHSSTDAAMQVLNAGIRRIPRSAVLLTVRGAIYSFLGEDQKAQADFVLAEQVNPNSGMGTVGRSLHLRDQGKSLEATDMLRQELKKSPKDVVVKYFLAESLITNGSPPSMKEAQGLLQDVLRHRPDDSNVLLGLAKTFLAARDAKAALPLLLRARYLDPESPTILSRLLQTYRELGMQQQAMAAAGDLRHLVDENRSADLRRNRFHISATPQ
jgi:predicted Zn-dependent protease